MRHFVLNDMRHFVLNRIGIAQILALNRSIATEASVEEED